VESRDAYHEVPIVLLRHPRAMRAAIGTRYSGADTHLAISAGERE